MKIAELHQYAQFHKLDTVTPGWQPWENCSDEKYDEICMYIDQGYNYRARILYSDGRVYGKPK